MDAIRLYDSGAWLLSGGELLPDSPQTAGTLAQKGVAANKEEARAGTMAWDILQSHNTSGDTAALCLTFDALASHDITYVGVIQTAKASGLERFPVPYVLTNCHNSLCAVGGTLNEDDHAFGLSAAKKYGGVFVPPHLAVIHSYMRECYAGAGRMILGTDSHTRYGALGTLAIGEGGGEVAKQLLKRGYDIACPEVVCVYLTGSPVPGVGPQDVALAIIGAVFQNGYVKNKVMEFVGDGIAGLSADFRNGIDVMTTETACLSSIWQTDGVTEEYCASHGRPEAYRALSPQAVAYYDGAIVVDLAAVRPMIALPFHPSNVYAIETLQQNAEDILHQCEKDAEALFENAEVRFTLSDKLVDGRLRVDQGVIAGCAGGSFENIVDAAGIIGGRALGNGAFALSLYPESMPVALELARQGVTAKLMNSGAVLHTAFCGPCFGAGDTPANGGLSVRHTTRNFPNREGSKPTQGQIASVALMDARSVAATAANGGVLTAATDMVREALPRPLFHFDASAYQSRVYNGFGKALPRQELVYGPNIADWPEMGRLEENLLLGFASVITDPVTTTDELIPSGETSTYRSNPTAMARFTLSRKDPAYVGRAELWQQWEKRRLAGEGVPELDEAWKTVRQIPGCEGSSPENTGLGSLIYATKPGDGSAREQAASCQRVLGGWANLAQDYATKRYRSNLINWGLLPLVMDTRPDFEPGEWLFLPGIRNVLAAGETELVGYHIDGGLVTSLRLYLGELTQEERKILLAGCLINHYRT